MEKQIWIKATEHLFLPPPLPPPITIPVVAAVTISARLEFPALTFLDSIVIFIPAYYLRTASFTELTTLCRREAPCGFQAVGHACSTRCRPIDGGISQTTPPAGLQGEGAP
jgi:hypothetical protein